MTNQEAFDIMVTHLRKQGCKSETPGGDYCLYRGPNGLMCAVGVLIPDEEYKPEWDESGERVKEIAEECESLRGINTSLLEKMQFTHDCTGVEGWEERFRRYAKEFNLTLPPLEASHA